MNRRIVAALALAAALAAAVPAGADPPDSARFEGGCEFHAVRPETSSAWVGELHGFGVAYSVWHEHAPVTVDRLRCDLFVDGVSVAAAEAAGTGSVVVVPPRQITYQADDYAWVYLCETVEIVDAHGQPKSWQRCWGDPFLDPVPGPVRDAFEFYLKPHTCSAGLGCTVEELVFNPANAAFGAVDSVVCAVTAAHAGEHGTVRIEDDGDVYVAGWLWWDCPPYEW